MQNRILFKYNLHHVIFWVLVFALWHFLRYQDYPRGNIRLLSPTALLVSLIKTLDLAAMVYITNYILLPRLFYKKKYVLFCLVVIGMILLSSLIKMNVLGRILHLPSYYDLSNNLKTRIYDNVIPHFFLVMAGATIQLMMDVTRLQQRMAETAKEKAEAELNFLKSQMNPHFLFNSLNSVYFLIDKKNQEARQSLHKFSDMLRYQLYEVNGSKIPVEKEINYLQDYVDLQKLRKDDHYSVTFDHESDVKGFAIEPLLLIPFVENAFKHISHHSNGTNYVRVRLSCASGWLLFEVENSKDEIRTNEAHGGIGLVNVKRRLELLYPGKHVLDIVDTNDAYKVALKLEV